MENPAGTEVTQMPLQPLQPQPVQYSRKTTRKFDYLYYGIGLTQKDFLDLDDRIGCIECQQPQLQPIKTIAGEILKKLPLNDNESDDDGDDADTDDDDDDTDDDDLVELQAKLNKIINQKYPFVTLEAWPCCYYQENMKNMHPVFVLGICIKKQELFSFTEIEANDTMCRPEWKAQLTQALQELCLHDKPLKYYFLPDDCFYCT